MIRIPSEIGYRARNIQARLRNLHWYYLTQRRRSFVTRIQPDLKMRLYGGDELSHLIYCRHFEIKEREFLNSFLRDRDIFIDVGSNLGLFTLIASRKIGPTGRAFAFEPSPLTFARLEENVQLNGLANVHCVNAALSDHSGVDDFTQSEDGFAAWNSFAAPTRGEHLSTVPVKVITWDEFAKQQGLVGRVTMMKIDVEGWESRVIQGARLCLSRDDAPLLQVEFTDEAAQAAGTSCGALYAALEGLGYKMYSYDPETRGIISEPLRKQYPYANLLAVKNLEFLNSRLQRRAT